jgi:lactoylglutathione lyase
MHNLIHTLGLISAVLTTSAFLPQVIKAWRTRSTHDLSPPMFTLFFLGILGWLCYGILIRDLPIILANSITVVLAGIIIYFIFSSGSKARVSHTGIYVHNIELMKKFYTDHFGVKTGKKYKNPHEDHLYFLNFPSGTRIELIQADSGKNHFINQSWGHIVISLGSCSEVDRFTRKMKEKGIEIVSYPKLTGNGYYESTIRDPEGNLIKLTL